MLSGQYDAQKKKVKIVSLAASFKEQNHQRNKSLNYLVAIAALHSDNVRLPQVLLHALERFGLDDAALFWTEIHSARSTSGALGFDERGHARPHRLHAHAARELIHEAQLAHQPLTLVVELDELGRDAGVHLLRVMDQLLLAGAAEAVAQHAQTPHLLVAAHRLAMHRVPLAGTRVLVLLAQVRHRLGKHVRSVRTRLAHVHLKHPGTMCEINTKIAARTIKIFGFGHNPADFAI
jgi:hypothetical protein